MGLDKEVLLGWEGGRGRTDGGLLIGIGMELGDGQTRENIGSAGYRRVPKG